MRLSKNTLLVSAAMPLLASAVMFQRHERRRAAADTDAQIAAAENRSHDLQARTRDLETRIAALCQEMLQRGIDLDGGMDADAANYELQQRLSGELHAIPMEQGITIICDTFGSADFGKLSPEEEALQRSAEYIEVRHDVDELELSYSDVSAEEPQGPRALALLRRVEVMRSRLNEVKAAVLTKATATAAEDVKNQKAAAAGNDALRAKIRGQVEEVRARISEGAKMRDQYRRINGELRDLQSRIGQAGGEH